MRPRVVSTSDDLSVMDAASGRMKIVYKIMSKLYPYKQMELVAYPIKIRR